jgi:hypothetical protein
MSMTQPNSGASSEQRDPAEWRNRFGGAVIDPHGNETPITENMIREACQLLESQSIIGLHARSPVL